MRGLVRSAGDAIPGVLIGRCRLDGDVTVPGSPIRIEAEVSVPYGRPLAPWPSACAPRSAIGCAVTPS